MFRLIILAELSNIADTHQSGRGQHTIANREHKRRQSVSEPETPVTGRASRPSSILGSRSGGTSWSNLSNIGSFFTSTLRSGSRSSPGTPPPVPKNTMFSHDETEEEKEAVDGDVTPQNRSRRTSITSSIAPATLIQHAASSLESADEKSTRPNSRLGSSSSSAMSFGGRPKPILPVAARRSLRGGASAAQQTVTFGTTSVMPSPVTSTFPNSAASQAERPRRRVKVVNTAPRPR